MNEVNGKATDQMIDLTFSGRIDSNNATEVAEEISRITEGHKGQPVRIDVDNLEYISSAGLRVILKLRKDHPDVTIFNVNSEVYEILDMTGFTQMMEVKKAYRKVSIEGCEVIGQGANGTLYRIDRDNVVKVYNNADALEEIQNEREVARLALVLGIPTAISYDVVRVGDHYGSVFELLDARSFAKILSSTPEKIDWCVEEYTDMLKRIHSTVVPEGSLPDMKETGRKWAEFVKDHLPEAYGEKLCSMVEEIPHDDHMIHGDYHLKNLELTGDEVLLIDMDTLAVGHPVFELASMFNAFIGFSELDHSIVKNFQGFDFDLSAEFWNKSLKAYLGTDDEDRIKDVEDKSRILGYTRLIRRLIRRDGLNDPEGRELIEHWKKELMELLDKNDSLTFDVTIEEDSRECKSVSRVFPAEKDALMDVIDFTESTLGEAGCPMNVQIQLNIAVEEIFVNIAYYAYPDGKGNAEVRIDILENPKTAEITFIDSGVPYNPLAKDDPDITLAAEDRVEGGLGIFMVKNTMDDMRYEYRDGKNILTMKKIIDGGTDEQ